MYNYLLYDIFRVRLHYKPMFEFSFIVDNKLSTTILKVYQRLVTTALLGEKLSQR